MTLTQLKYAVAVERFGSFARAARECLVTQPTLSLQIQKLERHIGQEIFDRRKNPVVVTLYGQRVLEQARRVLNEADRLSELFQESKTELVGEVSLGLIPTVSTYLLPLIYDDLRKAHPGLNFRIYELPTSQLIERLERGTLDLAILATPLKMGSIVETPLYYEPFVPYFPPDYKGPRKPIAIDRFSKFDLVLLGEEHCFRDQSLQVCGLESAGRIECGSLETVRHMVDRGAGATLLPLLALTPADEERTGRFRGPEPAREISIAYARGFYKKRVLAALTKMISKHIPDRLLTRGKQRVIGLERLRT